jgi:hypothetical protein
VLGRALRPLTEDAGHDLGSRGTTAQLLRPSAVGEAMRDVDGVLDARATIYVQPTVTFVYPPHGQVDENIPVHEVLPILRSALVAVWKTGRFARAGGRG